MPTAVEGACWWEMLLSTDGYRYCTHELGLSRPTGWTLRVAGGGWCANWCSRPKTVVGTLAEAKQFVEVSFALELANV